MSIKRLEEKIQRLREFQLEQDQMLTGMGSSNTQLEGVVATLQNLLKNQLKLRSGDRRDSSKPKGLSERVEHILKEKKCTKGDKR